MALVGFDAISIGIARVGVVSDANAAAQAASQTWHADGGSLADALVAAQQSAGQHGETVLAGSLQVSADGTATVRIERTAATVLLHQLAPLRHLDTVVVTGHGRYGS